MATHEDKQMLRDANGDLIPQYWDITVAEFKPLTGLGGAQKVEVDNQIDLPTDYPDEAVKEELEQIKATQTQIISALQTTNDNLLATNDHLNSVIEDGRLQSDAQLVGSNDQYVMPTLRDIKVNHIDASSNNTVDSGGREIVEIKPSKGYMGKIIGTYFDMRAIPGEVEGNHVLTLFQGSSSYEVVFFGLDGKNGERLTIRGNRVVNSGLIYATQETFLSTVLGASFTEDLPLKIEYRNHTNVDATQARNVKLTIVEERIKGE